MANRHTRSLVRRLAPLLVALAVAGGCASQGLYRDAQRAELSGDWDTAVLKYLEAVRKNPDNIAYRAALMRAKVQAAQEHVRRGKRFYEADVLERALLEFRQAVELDPTNQFAEAELDRVLREMAARQAGAGGDSTIAEMKEQTRGVRAQPPVLNPRSKEPIDLIFSQPQPVQKIYEALGKAFGVNVLFDPKLKNPEIDIELIDVTAQSALEILMRTVGHFYKVLDERSIIIADDNPQNRRNYEDQVIQTFFLDNADVKEVITMVRSLIGAKNVAANEQLNAIVLRDTADKVKVAEQIILANDKAKAEVVVDVELLQINSSKLQDLGALLSQYSVGVGLDIDGNFEQSSDPIRFSDLEFLNQNNWFLNLPSVTYNFAKSASDAQTLA
ncbi:MAG: secretin N-terminal domain-containing protein, partial [Acidobacteriota bacterium]